MTDTELPPPSRPEDSAPEGETDDVQTAADTDGASDSLMSDQGDDPAESSQGSGQDSSVRATLLDSARLPDFIPRTVAALLVALACSLIVFTQLNPSAIFSDTVTTGGDMGAHVVAPDFLKDYLLPHGQLSGWTDDWYAGYPVYTFYMVVPAILMVLIDVGPPLWLGVLGLAAIVAGATYAYSLTRNRLYRGLIVLAGTVGGLLCIDLPENVAFKLVTISGLICLPFSVLFLARMCRAPWPVQMFVPLGALYFIFDSHFEILGGNAASTLAGEFSFSISLNLFIIALGLVVRGMETGRYMSLTALVVAGVAVTHVIPIFYLFVASIVAFLVRPGLLRLAWVSVTAMTAGLLASFWLLAFGIYSYFLNDMGWEESKNFGQLLFPDTLPYREVILALALIGAVMSFVRPQTFGMIMTGSAAGAALLVRFVQEPPLNRFWNERALPFWFLMLAMLAAVGAAHVVNAAASYAGYARDAVHGVAWSDRRAAWSIAGLSGATLAGAIFLLASPDMWIWLFPPAALLVVGVWMIVAFGNLGITAPGAVRTMLIGGTVVAAAFAVLLPTRSLKITRAATDEAGRPITAANGVPATSAWLGRDESVPAPTFQKDPPSTTMLNGYRFGPFVVTSRKNVVPDWASWNYSGYDAKPAYPEYENLMNTMKGLGKKYGCGRAMWEYFEGLGRYGTPMAPMLLPFYTDGCIGSMEGLFFEASMTTPYHFLNQAELSARPSSPKRDMPYGTLNVAQGVKHLQMYGVKYYMAKTEEAQTQADKVPDLEEVARVPSSIKTRSDDNKEETKNETARDWVIYLVKDSALVQGLAYAPAVMTDVGQSHDEWLDPTVSWYSDPNKWDVFLAADGPKSWPRVACKPAKEPAEPGKRQWGIPCAEEPEFKPTKVAKVSDIKYDNEDLSFKVDRVGTPILVKVSYFPRWKVKGAEGPYRVSPNLMVVVPTDKTVEMHYGNTWVEYLTWSMTLLGLVLVCLMAWFKPFPAAEPRYYLDDERPPSPPGGAVDDPDATLDPGVLAVVDPGQAIDPDVTYYPIEMIGNETLRTADTPPEGVEAVVIGGDAPDGAVLEVEESDALSADAPGVETKVVEGEASGQPNDPDATW